MLLYTSTRKLFKPVAVSFTYIPAVRNAMTFKVLPCADKIWCIGRSTFVKTDNWRWYADDKDESKKSAEAVRQSGEGIGKLDASNEGGFFYKLNKYRLKKLKEMLRGKDELKNESEQSGKKSDN